MSIKKRKLKNRLFGEIKIFLFAFFILLVLFSGYLALNYLIPKKGVLSPLAQQISNQRHDQLQGELEKYNIPFTRVDISSDSSYLVTLNDGSQVIISTDKNIENQISSLQLILSRLTIEGKRFKSLDFRYDKPVIVF